MKDKVVIEVIKMKGIKEVKKYLKQSKYKGEYTLENKKDMIRVKPINERNKIIYNSDFTAMSIIKDILIKYEENKYILLFYSLNNKYFEFHN